WNQVSDCCKPIKSCHIVGMASTQRSTLLSVKMEIAYKKVRAYRVGDVEVEFWQAFREIGKIVYREGKSELEFPAEWLGWTTRKPDWLGVSLPHTLLEEGRIGPRIESVAAQIHLALTLMKIPNVVTVQSQSVDASAEDREKILNEF